MYKKITLSFFLFFGFSIMVSAQCTSCINDENTFCYQNEKFEGYCAMFKDGQNVLQLSKKKKKKEVPFYKDETLENLLKIAGNKKLKLSAVDILFIQESLKDWNIENRKLGHEYTDSGLGIKILKEGTGVFPKKGETVVVHYSGFLEDGKKFDSSFDRDEPFSFPLGQGRVIKGWDEGVAKLKIGSRAILKIPASIGYGARGAGGVIPPNATLYFEIELLSVK